MAQITRITSEALQATIRRLLPSQIGFGEDLQATNVITPIIDVTPTAEGSQLPADLQQAVSFGAATSFLTQNTTQTLITTTGFYRIIGTAALQISASTGKNALFEINDGSTDKIVWALSSSTGIANEIVAQSFDFIVFLRAGDSFKAEASAGCTMRGSTRQIADVYGNTVNPSGFTFE